MPLYEYYCQACGERIEVIQKFSDPPLTDCASCGGPVEKLLSAPAIQFKGSGWYITDYARKNGASDNGKSTPAGEAKGEAKSESSDSGGKESSDKKSKETTNSSTSAD